MCLQVLDKEVEEKYKDRDYGWKVFHKGGVKKNDGLYSAVRGNGVAKDVGMWLDEFDHRYASTGYTHSGVYEVLQCDDDVESSYPIGWHIYLEEEDAIESAGSNSTCIIKKVFFREPLAWGYQDLESGALYTTPTVVAKEIMIEE